MSRMLYIGDREIAKGYLNGQIVYDSTPKGEFYLDFNRVNQDAIKIPFSYNDVADPSIEFSAGLNGLDTSRMNGVNNYFLIGRITTSLNQRRWGLRVLGNDLNALITSSTTMNYPDFLIEYSNQEVDVAVRFNTNDTVDLLVNGEVKATSAGNGRPTTTSVGCTVGAAAINNSGDPSNDFLEGSFKSFYFGDDLYECNEGSGFEVVSSQDIIGTGQTANAGQLTYWNNNVWNPINP